MISKSLCSIEEMSIAFTSITDAGVLSILRNMTQLKELHISLADNLTGESLFDECNQVVCPSLHRLYLMMNQSLRTLGKNKHFQTMFPNLQELGVGNSRIRDDSIEQLIGLQSLTCLDISSCSFLSNNMGHYLQQLSSLVNLGFTHSQLTARQWLNLVSRLPKLCTLIGSLPQQHALASRGRLSRKRKSVIRLQEYLDSNDRITILRFRTFH